MNDLNQFKDNSGNTVYSARELYSSLNIEMAFTNWFKSYISSLSLVAGQDYSELMPSHSINSDINKKRGRPAKDYALTMRTVMQISMRSNQVGKQMTKAVATEVTEKRQPLSIVDAAREIVRQADINQALMQENEGLSQAKELAEHKVEIAEKITEKVIEDTNEKLSHHKDQVDFAERVANDKKLYNIGSVAKLLQLKIGRNDLFEVLRNDKILMSSGNPVQDNEPYQQYKQYFERKMKKREGTSTKTGQPYSLVIYQTLANAHGLIWLSKRYGGENPDYAMSFKIEPVQEKIKFRGDL